MATKLFVNLPVKDLDRSKTFFSGLGFDFFGMTEGMASVIISEHTQVMLLTEPTFATYTTKEVVDTTKGTEVILVVGLETRGLVTNSSTRRSPRGSHPRAPLRSPVTPISVASPTWTVTTGRR